MAPRPALRQWNFVSPLPLFSVNPAFVMISGRGAWRVQSVHGQADRSVDLPNAIQMGLAFLSDSEEVTLLIVFNWSLVAESGG